MSGDESASESEQDSPEKRTMDFNTGAMQRPDNADPSQNIKRTGKKWVRPPPQTAAKPQRPSGTGKKWTPPPRPTDSYDSGSGSRSTGTRKWGASASAGGSGGAGDGTSGIGAGASVGVSASVSAPGFADLPPPPPPLPSAPIIDSSSDPTASSSHGDRHVSFQLDRNVEHSAPPTPADTTFPAPIGSVPASGDSSSGKSDFDVDIDFDVDQILADAGLDVPGKEARPGTDTTAAGGSGGSGAGAAAAGDDFGSVAAAAGRSSGAPGAGDGPSASLTVGSIDVSLGVGGRDDKGAGAAAAASAGADSGVPGTVCLACCMLLVVQKVNCSAFSTKFYHQLNRFVTSKWKCLISYTLHRTFRTHFLLIFVHREEDIHCSKFF